jgi:hypothetical protein
MVKRIHYGLFFGVAALLVAACGDDPDSLTGRASPNGGNGNGGGGDPNGGVPAELQCTEKPSGKSYVLFDGSKLEETRANENVGVNRARQKPYAVLAGEYKRVLGLVPASLATSASSFDAPPERWFEEMSHSGVSLSAFFDISFQGCMEYVKAQPELGALPTTDTASAQCAKLMRKAWSRTASPEEVAACTMLATEKTKTETNPQRRWAYVCSSILSSSQFLTF